VVLIKQNRFSYFLTEKGIEEAKKLEKKHLMDNPLKNLIEIIKTGSPQEVKEAKKQVEKFWRNVYIPKRGEGRKAFSIFLEEIKKFDQIQDIDHQAYFINTLKWPLWSIGEEYFEQWADFILKYIQHPSGKIRQAIIKVADYLIMDIILEVRADPSKKLSPEDKQRIQKNQERFGNFIFTVETLLGKYDEPRFHRYKYISSLPPSVYKSLQIFLSELLRSEALENTYLEWKYQKQKQEPDRFNMPGLELVQKEKEWDYYYDAMEYLNMGDTKMAKLLLQRAIKLNEDFVAGYMGLTAVAKEEKDREKEKAYVDLSFEKTRKVFPKWPEELHWGIIENRQYLRAICDKACVYHIEGNFSKAEKLYRLLLKLNPNDNQGVRYLLAGMFADLSPRDIDDMFDEGNAKQDWSKLEKLVEEQNKKHHFWIESSF